MEMEIETVIMPNHQVIVICYLNFGTYFDFSLYKFYCGKKTESVSIAHAFKLFLFELKLKYHINHS